MKSKLNYKRLKERIHLLEFALSHDRTMGDIKIIDAMKSIDMSIPNEYKGNSRWRKQTFNERADNHQIVIMILKGEIKI